MKIAMQITIQHNGNTILLTIAKKDFFISKLFTLIIHFIKNIFLDKL